jgi:hypothetical protein
MLADRGKNVCIAVLASLAVMRAEIPKVVPDVTFIKLEVDIPVLIERNFKRMQVAGEAMGMTLEEQWKLDDPDTVELRKKYGEEYNEDEYKKWLKDEWYAYYDAPTEAEKAFSHVIENSDYSIKGLEQLREILGLKGEFKYEPTKLENIQKERYAECNPNAWA